MSKTATLSLQLTVTGDGDNLQYTPPGWPFVNATAPAGGPIGVILASGNNTLVPPVGSLYMLLVPPSGSTNAKTLKGISGDTGYSISAANPTLASMPSSTSAIIVNAAAGETVTIVWF